MTASGSTSKLPPPFVVGETYFDRDGEYRVVSVDGAKITTERDDGRRTVEDAALKARIHRAVVADRGRALAGPRAVGGGRRPGVSIERQRMIELILGVEADGQEHSGVELDERLRQAAVELGYPEQGLSETHVNSNRSVFLNDGDWAKSLMTQEKLHEVAGSIGYVDAAGIRRHCKVYRITALGREELRRIGRARI